MSLFVRLFQSPEDRKHRFWQRKCMGRYATCTWISLSGHIHCTCIGSTAYRIWADTEANIDSVTCVHANGILRIVAAVSSSFKVPIPLAGKILSKFFVRSGQDAFFKLCKVISYYACSTQRLHYRRFGIRVPSRPIPHHFVPVRHLSKGFLRNICAFCDNVLHAGCHHSRKISILEEEVEMQKSYTTDESYSTKEDPYAEISSDSISCLPLSPVNCECNLARTSKPYIVTAPGSCPTCGSRRDEASRKTWDYGVIMSTIGPCRMETEEFTCSSSACGRKIISEGRDHCILIDKLTSAATHELLRRELHGVVISNGTITGRLSHFHSLVTANVCFGIIPPDPPCRSLQPSLDCVR